MALTALFVFTLIRLAQNTAADTHTIGPLTFSYVPTDSRAAVSSCLSTATGNLTIPSEIEIEHQWLGPLIYQIDHIYSEAFAGCSNLSGVDIPAGVRVIGEEAFIGCSGLGGISLPASVTYIGPDAFAGCSNLASIGNPAGITTIEPGTFAGCSSLTNIPVPPGVTSIGPFAFAGCSSLTSISIPEGVTGFGQGTFAGCSSLGTVGMPSSIAVIGSSAFEECSSLTSIALPSGLTTIMEYAFDGCSALTNVALPSSVTSIGQGAFGNCSSLASISIPAGVSSIEDDTFYGCSALTSVALPSSITSIGRSAFMYCDGLNVINIPTGVTSLDIRAFAYCGSLTSISIPAGVSSIESGTFEGCSSMSEIVLPPGLASIGPWAFFECSSLGDITIPVGVTSIGQQAFAFCGSLTDISIPEGVTSIASSTFVSCSNLTSIVLSNSVSSIGYAAFAGCSSLVDIAIPADVSSIGLAAFEGCSNLVSIAIPAEVTTIDDRAFNQCSNLSWCLFLGNAPASFGVDVFPASNFKIAYSRDSLGFDSGTWNGYPCEPASGIVNVGNAGRVVGTVRVLRNKKWTTLSLGEPVYVDDEIKAELNSYAQVVFLDGSKLNISPKGHVVIEEVAGKEPSALFLRKGEIRIYKSPARNPDGKLLIKTPVASEGVRGTTIIMEVTEDAGMLTSAIEVLEGLVDHENLLTNIVTELTAGESEAIVSPVEMHTLTLNHPSASLGSVWLNGTEITSFPHVVSYEEGTQIDLEAAASGTGVFSNWSGDFMSPNPEVTVFLEEDLMVTANFVEVTDFDSEHPELSPVGNSNGSARSDFLEYASGQDPTAPGTLPIVEFHEGLLTVRRRVNGLDANPEIQFSHNLGDWFPLEEGIHYYRVLSHEITGQSLTQVLELVPAVEGRRFFRQSFGP